MERKIIYSLIATMSICIIVFFAFQVNDADRTIKIGAVLSLSGPASYTGEEVRDGMLLAIEEINYWGGLNGRKIELVIEDSRTDPKRGIEVFNEMEAEHRPVLYVSTESGVSLPLSEQAEENEVTLVGLATSVKVPKREWSFSYYTVPEDEIRYMLPLLGELGIESLGVLYLNTTEFSHFHEILKGEFEMKGTSFKSESFGLDNTDFRDKIKDLGDMDAIYVLGMESHLEIVLRQLREMDFSEFIIGSSATSSPPVSDSSWTRGAYTAAPIIYDPNFIFSRDVRKKYETKYGKSFNHYAGIGYDFIRILKGLLEDEKTSRTSIKDILGDGFVYCGVFGCLNVEKGDHDITFPLYPAQIGRQNFKYV